MPLRITEEAHTMKKWFSKMGQLGLSDYFLFFSATKPAAEAARASITSAEASEV